MNIHCIFSPKSEKLATDVMTLYGQSALVTCDVIVVLGGDGFMLHAIQNHMKYEKPFYGINLGTYGALMNAVVPAEMLMETLAQAVPYVFYPLFFKGWTLEGQHVTGYTVNDVTLQRATYQTISFSLYMNQKCLLKRASGDGLIIATSVGSGAYNASAQGPILTPDVPVLAITPLNFFHPKGWNSHVVPDHVTIRVVIDPNEKRPALAHLDTISYPSIIDYQVQKDFTQPIVLLKSSIE